LTPKQGYGPGFMGVLTFLDPAGLVQNLLLNGVEIDINE
jgi:hypothetical protein